MEKRITVNLIVFILCFRRLPLKVHIFKVESSADIRRLNSAGGIFPSELWGRSSL